MKSEIFNSNIKPSYQRLRIHKYLSNNRNHPTVEQIYTDLKPEISTLSKTTVYNTLNAFANENIVQKLNIEDNEIRYDIDTTDHGHFKCKACRKIFDFNINLDCVKINGLNDFQVDKKSVYFKGICSECLKKIKQ